MHNRVKLASASAVFGGALLAAGGFGLANAAPPESVVNDGKVNVTVTAGGQQIGVLEDVSLTNAEALATSVCPEAGINTAAILALDVNGTALPACESVNDGGPTFAFAQNSPGQSENTPVQSPVTTPSSSTVAPTPAR